jgi:hypothetical protein
MVFYDQIDRGTEEGKRTAARLLNLRTALEQEIPKRNIGGTLLLATWNIREFDSPSYGDRKDEPLYYIAEIIDHFDLVAVQEVRDNLDALERLMDFLGSWWKYVLTDVTEGDPGNRERMAFLYDSRKVRFGGLAGEVVIPVVKTRGNKILEPAKHRTWSVSGLTGSGARYVPPTSSTGNPWPKTRSGWKRLGFWPRS